MGNRTAIDPRTAHRLSQLLFEGRGDELFRALARHVDECGLEVSEAALETLNAAVRRARLPMQDGMGASLKPLGEA